MARSTINRRDFGKLLGVGALASASPMVLARAAQAVEDIEITGYPAAGSVTALDGFDDAMKVFMRDHGIPNGTLAVTRGRKLLLARGYTQSALTSFVAQPDTLFRTASVSKPITATAVLRLIQDGHLAFGDLMHEVLGAHVSDARAKQITVLHLLQHLAGWDRDLVREAVFRDIEISSRYADPLPVGKANVQRFGFEGYTLQHNPGAGYHYSNFGYFVLGQIIEKVSGKPYAQYVQEKVFTPLGITRTRPGMSLQRAAGEVDEYHTTDTSPPVFPNLPDPVPDPYGGWNVENCNALGGWISSPVDLVRFAGIYDPPTDPAQQVLNATSIQNAFARPSVASSTATSWYGCGWRVQKVSAGLNTYHHGSKRGTWAALIRRADGVTFSALFNRNEAGVDYYGLDSLLHLAANNTTWPTFYDLYDIYY